LENLINVILAVLFHRKKSSINKSGIYFKCWCFVWDMAERWTHPPVKYCSWIWADTNL